MINLFLKSIGFGEIKKNSEIYMILEEIINNPDEQSITEDEYGNEFACFSSFFGKGFGISVCGNFITDSEFRMEYYYPFYRGSVASIYEPVEIERHASRQSYLGVCDEGRIGISLIFYVENVMEALYEKTYYKKESRSSSVNLSGLASEGTILLPVMKKMEPEKKKAKTRDRLNMIQKAKNGDQAAIESLTLEDMDTITDVNRRIFSEDILSIVETSFMPFGLEGDRYQLIGEITSVEKTQNNLSGEGVWKMIIDCNDIAIDVCINEKDLFGEPEIGRRFKGCVWLQGQLNY